MVYLRLLLSSCLCFFSYLSDVLCFLSLFLYLGCCLLLSHLVISFSYLICYITSVIICSYLNFYLSHLFSSHALSTLFSSSCLLSSLSIYLLLFSLSSSHISKVAIKMTSWKCRPSNSVLGNYCVQWLFRVELPRVINTLT